MTSSNFTNYTLALDAGNTQLLNTETLEKINDFISNAEHTLNTAKIYFLKNGLKLNAKKTMHLHGRAANNS